MGILKSFYRGSVNECKQSIYNLLERNPKAKILDLGCWDGELSLEVAKRIGTKKVYGIEIVKEKIKEAKSRGVNAFQGDLNKKFPFKDNFFDVIIANQVIEHLYDTDNFVQEIRRILKPNGYSVISTNNLSSWHNIFALILGHQPFPSDVSKYVGVGKLFALWKDDAGSFSHLRIFSYSALKGIFKKYEFKIEKHKGIGYYPFPVTISRFLSKIDPWHSVYQTIKVRKITK